MSKQEVRGGGLKAEGVGRGELIRNEQALILSKKCYLVTRNWRETEASVIFLGVYKGLPQQGSQQKIGAVLRIKRRCRQSDKRRGARENYYPMGGGQR